ncbi:Large-conductance mechanosensitive channel [Mycovorax composti]|jgi:large conductance mechanosensitive channel protein|uniref:Large-conductance mechanosensitive channel n=2 Tax=Chitinophagaceae TaxID=563835 RepID=A0ABZ2EIT1_9BACT
MGMLKDFKEFALRGNVVDLAVAVIIGGAFGAIVTSLVEDLITPVILNPALKAAGAENIEKLAWNGILYGKFLAAVLKFIVIAFVLFLLIRLANKFKKQEEAAPAEPSSTDKLLAEIRDELKKRP